MSVGKAARDWTRMYQFLWSLGICVMVTLLYFFIQRTMRTTKIEHRIASWTTSSKLPWGELAERDLGQPTVTIFYQTGRGYCFDSIHSEQVQRVLAASQHATVDVDYRVFLLHGKYVGYEIASVGGIAFKSGQPPDLDGWAEGGDVSNNCHQ